MSSPQHFLSKLKSAQVRRQNKQSAQVTTTVATTIVETKVATATTKLTQEQYRNIILCKAITFIRGKL